MKHVMILGAGIMQIPALEIAREMGWKTFCVDRDADAPAVPLCDHFLPIDLKDRVGLAKAAIAYKEKYGLDGVMTVGTDFSPSVAWVAEKAGLPGIPFQTALDASDKVRMRAKFEEAGLPSPGYIEMSPEMGPLTPLETLSFPLVVKPVDNMGARGVRRVDNEAELIEAIGKAITFSRSDRAIVEEFLEGDEFSIDALVYNGKVEIYGIADRHIYFPPYFIEMGHTIPSIADEETLRVIIETFKEAVKAVGIENGAAKGDIKFSRGKAWIGEIAARLSGGFMSGWTYPYCSGRSAVREALKICTGMEPDFNVKVEDRYTAERAFISIPGKIGSLENLETAHKMQLVKDLFILKDEGDEVDFPRNNVEKVGNVIASGKDRTRAVNAAERAARSIFVRLERNNPKTAEYLGSLEEFPPAAFSEKSEALTKLAEQYGPADFANLPFDEWEAVQVPKDIISPDAADWQGRKVSEVFKTVTGEFKLEKGEASLFSYYFWTALLRGSLQGATWFLESIKEK
ncbi:MAG: ATP-grasp domain-containing protein [Spirochaetales bacterium]|nr:ATP-grasp domain-containing protein [Spirochaetales bacterium]